MNVLGITGELYAGKTTIAKLFCELNNTYSIDADEIFKNLLTNDDIQAQLFKRWGHMPEIKVIKITGNAITPAKVSKIIFSNEEELLFVYDICQPIIEALVLDRMFYYDNERTQLMVIDCTFLYEFNLDHYCADRIFISAPEDVRLKRTGGINSESFLKREKIFTNGVSYADKKLWVDKVLINDGSIEYSREQVKSLWKEYTGDE